MADWFVAASDDDGEASEGGETTPKRKKSRCEPSSERIADLYQRVARDGFIKLSSTTDEAERTGEKVDEDDERSRMAETLFEDPAVVKEREKAKKEKDPYLTDSSDSDANEAFLLRKNKRPVARASTSKRGKHKVVGKISNVMKHLPAFDPEMSSSSSPRHNMSFLSPSESRTDTCAKQAGTVFQSQKEI
ncbi:uncharacterized protein [Oscarella lobularis]|uniref:uncharacterized protein isoform X1 n=1 Tax=Oscarella lobularis TaxID=121494 RepID=UPI0033130A22